MNRTIANIIIDLAAALLFVGMIATGYVMRFPLPPGTNRILTLWGLTRHQWGAIHYWISLGLLAVIAAHLVLHWKWIVTVVGKRLRLVTKPHPSMVRSGLIVAGIFGVSIGLFGFAVHWSVREMEEPLHKLDLSNDDGPDEISRPEIRTTESPSRIGFWVDVYPVFEKRCVSCHGPRRQLGDFRVDQREDFFGKHGEQPLIVPGNSADSTLIAIVSGAKSGLRMLDKHQLPENEVRLLSVWIDAGADWPDVQE
jgi:hypothetical protein